MSRSQRSPEAQDYHKWYKRTVWLGIRESQLSAYPLCAMCGELANTCDHVEPHNGDWMKFVSGPFQSLCGPCHSSAKQSQERTGYLKGVDQGGNPIDPLHPWNMQPAHSARS